VWDRLCELAAQTAEEHQELSDQCIYNDDFTFRLFQEASDLCGVPKTELLEGFGEQFLIWCREHGYDQTLQSLGATLRDFLDYLDSLHDHLETHMFPGMKAPSFRCSDGPNGEIYLHYYSCRRGLEHLVIGIIKTVCRQLHNTIVEMKVVQEVDDSSDHVVFAIEEMGPVECERDPSTHSLQGFRPDHSYIDEVNCSSISAAQFCQILPFHVLFDSHQRILQMGSSLFRVLKSYDLDARAKVKLSELFDVERPQGMTLNFNCIRSHINTVFILSLKTFHSPASLRLKGQMMVLSNGEDSAGKMLFLCSPRIGNLDELSRSHLYLSDLPLHDATRDLILLDDTESRQHCQIVKLENLNSGLNAAHEALEKTHKELLNQNEITGKLLHSLFPVHVAKELKLKKEVTPEMFSSVTVLFGDIHDFTNICARCSPGEIVKMLDRVYKEFDTVAWENNVFKIETVTGGDYMVVGGLANRTECHAEIICNQALDMLVVVAKVKNPVDPEDHIHIQVGIHSGEAMAGVVGRLMPRYCLFGDTVNIASRAKSTGKPDKIQVTEATYKALEMKPHFVFEQPHLVTMKNIPRPVLCYFLVENKERISRMLHLKERRASLVPVPRVFEGKAQQNSLGNMGENTKFALSSITEENKPIQRETYEAVTSTTHEIERHSEAVQSSIASPRKAGTRYQKEKAPREKITASPTLHLSIVWLVVAFLITGVAFVIAMHIS
jgi:guanylate cyclase soluble subunit beta